MKGLAAAALVLVCIVLPACAQRSSGRGGSSGHSAPAFHGGASVPRGFSGGRGGFIPGRAISVPRTQQTGASSAFRRRPPYPPSYLGRSRYRRPYVSPYRSVIPYRVSAWIAPYYLGSPDDTGEDDSLASANPAAEGYDGQADEQQLPPWPSGYDQGPTAPLPAFSQPTPSPQSNEVVTFVFKDGRPSIQIHNYLLTRDTLYVGDRRPSEIPVDQLDVDATVKANREAGVDFRLPVASR
jgi:hypothetical protein